MSAAFATIGLRAIGTTAVAVVQARAEARARALLVDELAAIDRACSRFRADSELSRANAEAGRITPVSPLFAQALDVALWAAQQTDGAVDPTVAPTMVALGYDRDYAELALDATAAVRGVPAAGWRTVELDLHRGLLRLAPGTRLDLGATAKALAADRAAAAIASATGSPALVSLGGDVATAGPTPYAGWTIRVTDDHRSTAGGQTISIAGGGVATSSTTVRRWRRGGRTIHHIVDPRTGEPAPTSWRTVSVAAASCVDANTATTAAIVRGAEAPQWLHGVGLPARLVDSDGGVVTVNGWPRER